MQKFMEIIMEHQSLSVEEMLDEGKDVILEIDIQGALKG